MAILTAQKTAPLCHPLPPGAFAIFFNQPLHSGWVATVCTVLAGAVWLKRYASWTFQAGFSAFRLFNELCAKRMSLIFAILIVCKAGGKRFKSVQRATANITDSWLHYLIKQPWKAYKKWNKGVLSNRLHYIPNQFCQYRYHFSDMVKISYQSKNFILICNTWITLRILTFLLVSVVVKSLLYAISAHLNMTYFKALWNTGTFQVWKENVWFWPRQLLYWPHKSVCKVLHEWVNLEPVSRDTSRPETRKQQSVCRSSAAADCVLGSKTLYSICALYHNHSWTLTPATCWIIVPISLCSIAATSAVTTLECSQGCCLSTNLVGWES